MKVSERRIKDIWHEYQHDISNHIDNHEILKKARHDCPSQLDQDTTIAIDTATFEKTVIVSIEICNWSWKKRHFAKTTTAWKWCD